MKLKLGTTAVSLLAFASVFAPLPSYADGVLYDNSGPGSYTTNAWSLYGASAVTNSFSLSHGASITGINFYIWTLPGDTQTSENWSISSTPFGSSIASGSSSGGPNTQVAVAEGYYTVLKESISVPSLLLTSGTYWLTLTNGLDGYNINTFWDESDGTSNAFDSDYGQIPSETFQVIGSPVPEPSSLMLLGTGLTTLAGLATRRKRRA